jgi:hypothetical protein
VVCAAQINYDLTPDHCLQAEEARFLPDEAEIGRSMHRWCGTLAEEIMGKPTRYDGYSRFDSELAAFPLQMSLNWASRVHISQLLGQTV